MKDYRKWVKSLFCCHSGNRGSSSRSLLPMISLNTEPVAAVIHPTARDLVSVQYSWASSIRIQAVIRGYFARKALRALKTVVRVQALFRGGHVREKADKVFRCREAMINIRILYNNIKIYYLSPLGCMLAKRSLSFSLELKSAAIANQAT
ncbi:hypothetical protein GOBAR_AA26669 [Gossypium barbadense]|uniref:DUF4005 domain-containing protein n=2 Tax=Gossypium TaxID=3633 RepID=A0A2P5WSI0_GOSBA|nr:hypothetical protein GOBAR_AA26669 [Gossypium barbadense]